MRELLQIRIRRLRIQAAAEDVYWMFDINAALGDKLEAKLKATTNPLVREGHKQSYLNWLSRAEQLLGINNLY